MIKGGVMHGSSKGDIRKQHQQQFRVFVGIKLIEPITRELSEYADPIRDLPLKLIPLNDMHVTLLPPWMTEDISAVLGKLRGAVHTTKQFTLEFQRVRYGPTLTTPRFLWAECAATSQIFALRSQLVNTFNLEEQAPFQAHATIARLPMNDRELVRQHPIDVDISLLERVSSIELFLSPHGGGFGYTVIESTPLSNAKRDE
jgi:2'-5' RNA ligase